MVVVGPNLVGAKYTLAVPAYTYDAGLKDFNDIHRLAAALKNSIYGIEPVSYTHLDVYKRQLAGSAAINYLYGKDQTVSAGTATTTNTLDSALVYGDRCV